MVRRQNLAHSNYRQCWAGPSAGVSFRHLSRPRTQYSNIGHRQHDEHHTWLSASLPSLSLVKYSPPEDVGGSRVQAIIQTYKQSSNQNLLGKGQFSSNLFSIESRMCQIEVIARAELEVLRGSHITSDVSHCTLAQAWPRYTVMSPLALLHNSID